MLTFLTSPNSSKFSYLNVHEANVVVIIALIILSLFSIFFGYIFSDLFVGIGNNAFGSSLFIHPNHINLIEAEFSIPLLFKLMPALFSLLGSALAIILYQNKPEFIIGLTDNSKSQLNLGSSSLSISAVIGSAVDSWHIVQSKQTEYNTGKQEQSKGAVLINFGTGIGRKLYTFFNGKYFFDIIYNHYFSRSSLQFGFFVTNLLERGVIEFIGPYGLSNVLFLSGRNISKLDTGIVTTYALYIVLGLISLVFLIFTPLIFNLSTVGLLTEAPVPTQGFEFNALNIAAASHYTEANEINEYIRIIIIYISSFILYLMLNFNSK
jgi:NADH-ubiquinone oxidoreductase chain 5